MGHETPLAGDWAEHQKMETEPPLITYSTEPESPPAPALENADSAQNNPGDEISLMDGEILPSSPLETTEPSSGFLEQDSEVVADLPPVPQTAAAPSDGRLEAENVQLRSELLKLQRELDEAKSEVIWTC